MVIYLYMSRSIIEQIHLAVFPLAARRIDQVLETIWAAEIGRTRAAGYAATLAGLGTN